MKAVGRKLLPATVVTLAHACLFALLAVPLARPLRPEPSAAIDVDLVGPIQLDGAPTPSPAPARVSPPKPAPAEPEPAPSAGADALAPATPPVAAPPAESVEQLAARLIHETASRELVAAPIAPPVVSAPPPPPPPSTTAALPVAATGAAADCEIGGTLQSSLQADPQVQGALQAVPRTGRSVANAIMLWDGRWTDPTIYGGDAAIAPVRNAILAGVLAAPPDCRQKAVTGPRFMTVTAGAGTTVVTVGSGVWRWADLLETASR